MSNKRTRTSNDMSSKRNFLDAVHFLYSCGKLFGISCYSISKRDTKYEVSFGISDFLRLISFVGVYLTLLYYNLTSEWKIVNDAKNAVIFNSGQQILIQISLVLIVLGTIQITVMRHEFWEIANSLHSIDNQMMQLLKIQINHNNLYRYTLIYVTISYVTLAMVYSCLAYYFFIIGTGMVIQYILSFVLANGAFVLMAIQFQFLIYSTYLRFSALTGFVESNILHTEHHLLLSSKTLEYQQHIVSIAKIADQLNNVVPKLCYFFSGTLISAVAGVFCISVFNFHNFYRAIIGRNSFQFWLLIMTYDLLSLLFSISVLLCIIVTSSNTSSAKKMGILVHKIIARTHDKNFILKLKLLSQQILHRSPDFSFGLFSFNWSFVYTYIASVVSYIVILIQFENYIADNSTKSLQFENRNHSV